MRDSVEYGDGVLSSADVAAVARFAVMSKHYIAFLDGTTGCSVCLVALTAPSSPEAP